MVSPRHRASASVDGGKPWSYVLIPHNAIMENQAFAYLLGRFVVCPPAELA